MEEKVKRKKKSSIFFSTLGIILLVTGAALVGAHYFAPETIKPLQEFAEKSYGQARGVINQVSQDISQELPSVRLEGEGGKAELDNCTGAFQAMVSYRDPRLPEVYAAHHRCGGDVILNWGVGSQFTVEGRPDIYEVVEVRNTTQTWAVTDDLFGLQGEFALQSCFYGENRMQFVGAKKVEPATPVEPTPGASLPAG